VLGWCSLRFAGYVAVRHLRTFWLRRHKRRHHRSPTMAVSPAGQGSRERPNGPCHRNNTDALFAAKVQSFPQEI
jgi:hypothetical protein